MSGPVILEVPLPPNRANSRAHKWAAHKEKKRYWEALNMMEAMGRFRQPPEPFDPARISVHYHLWNLMDDDNAMARIKPLLDWMEGVYIVDDSRRHLVWDGIPGQTIDRRNPGRVVVTVGPA